MPTLDSAGVRALVRGHTSAQRVAGSLRIAGLKPAVRQVLELSRLGDVLEIYDSVEAARIAALAVAEHPHLGVDRGGFCGALVAIGHEWPTQLSGIARRRRRRSCRSGGRRAARPVYRVSPFIELLKLVAAAAIGQLVTSIHQPSPRERPLARSMEQAQTLLCVSGAMMMIIIGNNLARAFGIAGAASIIRFRTPVDDPKDVTILFLLMALGMATGLGSFAVAGLGTAFLCVALLVLDRFAAQSTRRHVGRDPRPRPAVSDQPCRGRLRRAIRSCSSRAKSRRPTT